MLAFSIDSLQYVIRYGRMICSAVIRYGRLIRGTLSTTDIQCIIIMTLTLSVTDSFANPHFKILRRCVLNRKRRTNPRKREAIIDFEMVWIIFWNFKKCFFQEEVYINLLCRHLVVAANQREINGSKSRERSESDKEGTDWSSGSESIIPCSTFPNTTVFLVKSTG